jgi:hypothetical protein
MTKDEILTILSNSGNEKRKQHDIILNQKNIKSSNGTQIGIQNNIGGKNE